ncbi:MAG TPA: VanW family protein [Acidimicrobiales bacterium]|nr:VanW family protein [Acidimicrobiales bacterium]
MPRRFRRFLYALAALLGVVVAVLAAWAIDANGHDGKVLRNVTLAGRDVSDLTRAQLDRIVAEVADEVPTQQVEVRADGGGFTVPAADLGVTVDRAATARAALDLGRTGGLPERFAEWIGSFRGERRAPVQVAVDERAVYRTVAAEDPGPRTPPTEPSIAFRDGALRAVEGEDGEGIDARDVIEGLPGAATSGRTIVVSVDRGDVEPRFPMIEAERLAGEVQAKVSTPMPVAAGEARATVPVATLRSWITSEPRDDGLHPEVEPEAALGDLAKLLEAAGEAAVETRFTVEGDAVKLIPGRSGTRCCADEAVRIVETALFDDASAPPPALPLTTRPPDLTVEEAQQLGVNAPIASFTTRHPGGQPRVRNIHHIADLLRGTLIQPGRTFSVNDTVGRRTAAKGFVSAPVIEEGRFSESVGGGISQFATTLFNAAFEAGLDFGEYQSHSIYISRYPYGREATLSYPAPDLEIENTSPYGVLLWPTYTETTITVTIYSTKFAEVRQSGQSESPRGACKRVRTERTRTWLADGRVEVDAVFATYRPGEGVNC